MDGIGCPPLSGLLKNPNRRRHREAALAAVATYR